jgi:hypothetical protein
MCNKVDILLSVHGLGELRVLGSEYDMRLGNIEVICLTERLHRGRESRPL